MPINPQQRFKRFPIFELSPINYRFQRRVCFRPPPGAVARGSLFDESLKGAAPFHKRCWSATLPDDAGNTTSDPDVSPNARTTFARSSHFDLQRATRPDVSQFRYLPTVSSHCHFTRGCSNKAYGSEETTKGMSVEEHLEYHQSTSSIAPDVQTTPFDQMAFLPLFC